ncbi:MAG: hypothetical protein GY925_20460, partial [Actinomycetia bacterium]|nr:hypothetical protein [Actinomycetes bacterium]
MSTSDDGTVPEGDPALEVAIRDVSEPVPDRLRAMAVGAFVWGSIDAELADLVETQPVRSNVAASRFQSQAVFIDVELGPVVDARRDVSIVLDGDDVGAALALVTSAGERLDLDVTDGTASASVPAMG